MKKNFVSLLCAIVVLGGLTGVYYYLQDKEPAVVDAEPEATEEPYYYLNQRTKDELQSFTLADDENTLSFSKLEGEEGSGSWYIEEYPDAELYSYGVDGLATSAYTLSTDLKLTDEPESLSDFGLDPPQRILTSKYQDGTECVIYIGGMTPAKDYYYAMREGDPALYGIYKYTGDRFFYDITDLVSTSIPTISPDNLVYAYINEFGKQEIELGFDGSEEEKNEQLSGYGTVIMTMFKPYAGREVYSSNFAEFILADVANIKVNEVIEYDVGDFAQYGLEEPVLEILLEDINGELHIFVGDETDDGYRYCRLADKDWVFTVKSANLEKFYNIKVNSFVERFVALVYINSIEKIEIRSDKADYDIVLNMDQDDEGYEIFFPTLNEQEVQELAFKTFYQRLIGLSYDAEIPQYEPESEPAISITFYPFDGPPIETKYYDYNNDFYAVQKDDYDIQFVVSKHSTGIMFDAAVDLLAGKLDRDY